MKKITKKVTCVFMTLVIMVSAFFCFSINVFAEYPGQVPVIFIVGEGSTLGIKQDDGTYKTLSYSVNVSQVTNMITSNKKVLAKAFLTQDWREFDAMLIDLMTDMYKDVVLDKTGEPTNGSEVTWHPTLQWCKNRLKGDYGLMTFYFRYDWRLDPSESVDSLASYIDMVLEATGSDKYAICARCEGSCLALQYYNDTHDNRITDIVMYSSAAQGASPISEAFAGEIYLDPDAVERFVYDRDFGINKQLVGDITFTDASLRKILTVVSNVYGLDLGCWAVNNVYAQIYMDLVPQILRNAYASFPGYWAMVSDKYYEKAKEVCFGGMEDEYSVFIKKIDAFHYNIMNRSEEILKEAQDNGIEISNIVKYGKAVVPIIENCDVQSDGICNVYEAGWGVNSVDIGETFSSDYIAKAKGNGTYKYISPDNCIDASTSFLKDTTWFIRNLGHKAFPDCVDDLVFAIVNNSGMTVESSSDYPQYMFYDEDEDTISPYNPTTMKSRLDNYETDVTASFFRKVKPYFVLGFKLNTFIINLLMPSVKS